MIVDGCNLGIAGSVEVICEQTGPDSLEPPRHLQVMIWLAWLVAREVQTRWGKVWPDASVAGAWEE